MSNMNYYKTTYETEEIREVEGSVPVKIRYQFTESNSEEHRDVKIISWEPALSRDEMKDKWSFDDEEIDSTMEEIRKYWFDSHRAEEYLYDEIFNDEKPSIWFELESVVKYPTIIK